MLQSIDTTGLVKEIIIAPKTQVPEELSHWIEQVASMRDKQAFTNLFEYFAPKIKRFGLNKFNNEALANELVQETMTSIWKKSYMYKAQRGAATTWAYTIMRNASFDMLRKIKHRSESALSDNIWPVDALDDGLAHEWDVFQDHLMSKQLLQHLERLPDAQQAVVRGVYFYDLSQEQLATQLDIPIGTVKSRLRLALEKLKQYIEEPHHD